jgi:hypothetical protein
MCDCHCVQHGDTVAWARHGHGSGCPPELATVVAVGPRVVTLRLQDGGVAVDSVPREEVVLVTRLGGRAGDPAQSVGDGTDVVARAAGAALRLQNTVLLGLYEVRAALSLAPAAAAAAAARATAPCVAAPCCCCDTTPLDARCATCAAYTP